MTKTDAEKMSMNDLLDEMGLTKDDFVAIRTSHKEQELLTQKKTLTAEMKKLETELKKGDEAKLTELKKLEKAAIKKEQKRVGAALKKLGFGEVKVETRSGLSHNENYEFSIGFNYTQTDCYGGLHTDAKVLPTAALKKIIKDTKKTSDALLEAKMALIDTKKDLANLSSEERFARAQLATEKLKGTELGMQLLSSIVNAKSLTYSGV